MALTITCNPSSSSYIFFYLSLQLAVSFFTVSYSSSLPYQLTTSPRLSSTNSLLQTHPVTQPILKIQLVNPSITSCLFWPLLFAPLSSSSDSIFASLGSFPSFFLSLFFCLLHPLGNELSFTSVPSCATFGHLSPLPTGFSWLRGPKRSSSVSYTLYRFDLGRSGGVCPSHFIISIHHTISSHVPTVALVPFLSLVVVRSPNPTTTVLFTVSGEPRAQFMSLTPCLHP